MAKALRNKTAFQRQTT